MSSLQWDDKRCAELGQFERLLHEVLSINKGGQCLERIARCIELAGPLNNFDYKGERMTFRQFLNDLAIADRLARKALETNPEGGEHG